RKLCSFPNVSLARSSCLVHLAYRRASRSPPPGLEACAIIGVLSVPKGLTCSVFTCLTLPAGVWMDRRQALAGLELRTLQSPAAPSLAPRRSRRRGLAGSPDTLSAPVTGWRRRLTTVRLTSRSQAARLAAPPLRSSS